MNKKVVYTSIIGGYDTLIQPPAIDESFDYICFVKKGQRHSETQGVWRIEEIPFDSSNNKLLAEYPKLQPHVVLPQYDYCLWIDGNISINDAQLYDTVNKKIEEGVMYSGVNHWGWDCAYDDAVMVAYLNKSSFQDLLRTVIFLKRKHFPRHFGLYETGVLLRKHNEPTMVSFDNLWWYLLYNYARRDQLCLPYCLKKFGIEFDYLVPKEYCARNHHFFIYKKHTVLPKCQQGINRRILIAMCRIKGRFLKLLSLI